MAKLNLVPGLKVILSGDNKCNLKTAIECARARARGGHPPCARPSR